MCVVVEQRPRKKEGPSRIRRIVDAQTALTPFADSSLISVPAELENIKDQYQLLWSKSKIKIASKDLEQIQDEDQFQVHKNMSQLFQNRNCL